MGCATSLVKYIVFFFNFVFLLVSIAFIVAGVLVKLGLDAVLNSIESYGIPLGAAPILIIVVGCIVFVISFLGCCGAIRESTCMLTTYAVILLVLLIAQVALGIYVFVQTKDGTNLQNEIEKAFLDVMQKYNEDDAIKESIDAVQSESECCGSKGPSDWITIGTGVIPSSCCSGKPQNCQQVEAYQTGCAKISSDFLKKSMTIIGIVVITIAAVELGGAIVALCLSSSIRNNERRGHYA